MATKYQASLNRMAKWLFISGSVQALQDDIRFLHFNAFNNKYGTRKSSDIELEAEFRRTYGELKKSKSSISKQRANELEQAYKNRKNPPPTPSSYDLIGIQTKAKYKVPSSIWIPMFIEFVKSIEVWDAIDSEYDYNSWNQYNAYYFWSLLPEEEIADTALDFTDNVLRFRYFWEQYSLQFEKIALIVKFYSSDGIERYIQTQLYDSSVKATYNSCVNDLEDKIKNFLNVVHDRETEFDVKERYSSKRDKDEEDEEPDWYLERIGFIFYSQSVIIQNAKLERV